MSHHPFIFIRNFSVIIILFCFLSACSVFGPVDAQPATAYLINVQVHPPTKKTRPISLFVAPVESDSVYNTTQMAYTTQAYQIAYFAKSRWADTPAKMLQPLIVQTLQNTHHFHAVSSSLALGAYDYILNTQLIELKQVFVGSTSQVHLKLRAQLISTSSNRVIAVKEFSVSVNTIQRNPYSGVIAANQATAILLNQLARFCLQKI